MQVMTILLLITIQSPISRFMLIPIVQKRVVSIYRNIHLSRYGYVGLSKSAALYLWKFKINILDQYQVILLDMNSTFMFGEDRFGESEVFYTTYQQVANGQLSSDIVERTIRDCYQGLFKDYEDPGKYDDFPSLHEGLLHYGGIDEQHVEDMTQLFVRHEIGIVPQDHANLLQNWSSKYQLGVVSNIWAKKEPWLEEFRRVGIDDIWQTIIFLRTVVVSNPL